MRVARGTDHDSDRSPGPRAESGDQRRSYSAGLSRGTERDDDSPSDLYDLEDALDAAIYHNQDQRASFDAHGESDSHPVHADGEAQRCSYPKCDGVAASPLRRCQRAGCTRYLHVDCVAEIVQEEEPRWCFPCAQSEVRAGRLAWTEAYEMEVEDDGTGVAGNPEHAPAGDANIGRQQRPRASITDLLRRGRITLPHLRKKTVARKLKKILSSLAVLEVCCGANYVLLINPHSNVLRSATSKYCTPLLSPLVSNITTAFFPIIDSERVKDRQQSTQHHFRDLTLKQKQSIVSAVQNAAIYNRRRRFPFQNANGVVPEALKSQYPWYPDVAYTQPQQLSESALCVLFAACAKNAENIVARLRQSTSLNSAGLHLALACMNAEGVQDDGGGGGTLREGEVLKIRGRATRASVLDCLRSSNSFPTIVRNGGTTSGTDNMGRSFSIPLSDLYNAVLDCGGCDNVINGEDSSDLRQRVARIVGVPGIGSQRLKHLITNYLYNITPEAAKSLPVNYDTSGSEREVQPQVNGQEQRDSGSGSEDAAEDSELLASEGDEEEQPPYGRQLRGSGSNDDSADDDGVSVSDPEIEDPLNDRDLIPCAMEQELRGSQDNHSGHLAPSDASQESQRLQTRRISRRAKRTGTTLHFHDEASPPSRSQEVTNASELVVSARQRKRRLAQGEDRTPSESRRPTGGVCARPVRSTAGKQSEEFRDLFGIRAEGTGRTLNFHDEASPSGRSQEVTNAEDLFVSARQRKRRLAQGGDRTPSETRTPSGGVCARPVRSTAGKQSEEFRKLFGKDPST